jgi:UPF0176 protein
MQLYNTLSAQERAALIDKAGDERLTLSFYTYAHIDNPQLFRDFLFIHWNKLEVLGRIYVSFEGINAQLSVPAKKFDLFKSHLDSVDFLNGIRLNIAIEQYNKSFLKLKIKVRQKIVADGLDDSTFDVTNCGVHVNAETFNKLVQDPDTLLVDMRNHYESEIGHFEGAITPDVDTFRQSLTLIEKDLEAHKSDKKLVMYCTGGIRCEKASAYFKHKGFEEVYQLEGGIIEYARQVEAQGLDNKFKGKNFVFDERRAERISEEVIAVCHQCGTPCDTHVNCANEACHLLFIQCESCAASHKGCCSSECEEVVQLPEAEQKRMRRGTKNSNKIFKKGRSTALAYMNKSDK